MSNPVPTAPRKDSWSWECPPVPLALRSTQVLVSQTLFSPSGRLQPPAYLCPTLPGPGNLPASSTSCRTHGKAVNLSLAFQKVRAQAGPQRRQTDSLLQGSRNLPAQPLPSGAPACCSGFYTSLPLSIPLPPVTRMPYSPPATPSLAVRAPPPFPSAKFYTLSPAFAHFYWPRNGFLLPPKKDFSEKVWIRRSKVTSPRLS